MVIGARKCHGDLAIILLAKLPTILARYADRVLSLLGEAGVIDNPRLNRPGPFHLWPHHLAHLAEDRLVRPAPLADEVQQRLMLGRNPLRCSERCHRLYALALTRQQ